MPLFFKMILSLLALLFSLSSKALEINAYYSDLCKREIGVIVGIEDYNIFVLNLAGNIVEMPRYAVISIAQYPLDVFTLNRPIKTSGTVMKQHFRIRTRYKREITDLVVGWPINFSKDNISFLNLKGEEVIIRKRSIWEIEKLTTPYAVTFVSKKMALHQFTHPSNSMHCPLESHGVAKKGAAPIKIRPQEYISDPVKIKRHFDFLVREKKKLYRLHSRAKVLPHSRDIQKQILHGFLVAKQSTPWRQ